MIIDHFRPSDPGVTVNYLLRRDGPKKGDTALPRILALHDIFSPETAAAELASRMSKTRRKSDLVHLFVRCERSMTDAEMLQAAECVLAELGLVDRPHMAVVHDKDGHLHVLAAVADERGDAPPRMGYSKALGRAVSREEEKHLPRGEVTSRPWDSFLTRRLMRVARSLEEEWGLRRLNARKNRDRNGVSDRARALAKEYGAEPLAIRKGAAIETAIRSARSWPALATKLAQADVGLDLVVHPKSAKRGLRFLDASNPALTCAASALGRGLPALEAKWGTFEFGFDRQSLVLPRSTDPTYAAAYDRYAAEVAAIRQSKAAKASTSRRQRSDAADRGAALSILGMHGVSGPTARELLKAAGSAIDTAGKARRPMGSPKRIRPFAEFVSELARQDPRFVRLAAHLKQDGNRLTWELIQTRKQSRTEPAPTVRAPVSQRIVLERTVTAQNARSLPLPEVSSALEMREAILQPSVEAKHEPVVPAAPAPPAPAPSSASVGGSTAVEPALRPVEACVQSVDEPTVIASTPRALDRPPVAPLSPAPTKQAIESERQQAAAKAKKEADRAAEAIAKEKAKDNLRQQYELKAKRNDAWERTPWG